jgi:peptidoglycan/LPS O-acetylase OafA/YrhL
MSSQKFELLTWLRGIAAFFVIVNHTALAAKEKYSLLDGEPYLQPFAFFDLGTFAVYLFFVLSGCTLTLNYANKINNAAHFASFYIKRFFRIWPAYVASIAIYLLFREFFQVFYLADPNAWVAPPFLVDYSFANVLQYLSLTFNISGPQRLFNCVYWSLPVEFQYYLMLPFALILMRNRFLNIAVPLIIGVALYFLYPLKIIPIDRIELLKMGFSFFGGVLLAKTYHYAPLKISTYISYILFGMVIVVCGAVVNNLVKIPEAIPFVSDVQNFFGLCALFTVALALVTHPPTITTRLARFLTLYGEISYSVYLFHMIFVGLAVILVVNFAVHAYLAQFFFILIFSLLGSYWLSLFTFKWIERPSVSLGAKLANSLKKNSAQPQLKSSL